MARGVDERFEKSYNRTRRATSNKVWMNVLVLERRILTTARTSGNMVHTGWLIEMWCAFPASERQEVPMAMIMSNPTM